MNIKALLVSVLQASLCVSASELVLAEDWWQFRGPNSGQITASQVPTQWGHSSQATVWSTPIPGKGWSSPIVVGDRIWLTSAEEVAIGTKEAAEKLATLPFGSRDIVVDGAVTLFAIELNAETGEILRRIDLFEKKSPPPLHAMNSYASPTPVTNGKRIVCHFGSLGTACIDIASGKIPWKRELAVEELTGGGASPVLLDSTLFFACDGADQQYLIALDELSGETKWKVSRPEINPVDDSQRRAFSTPLIVNSNGRKQVISLAAQWLVSYNPEDGGEWWRAKVGSGYSLVPTPVFDRDRVFVCTGFSQPEMVAVSTLGSGDITDSGILWRYSRQVPEISSPVVVGDEIYFVSDGIATCLDAASGTQVWQHRLGGKFAASLTATKTCLYLTSSGGVTTVIQPGREFIKLAANELFGESYASMAVYKHSLLLRTHPILYRLGSE